MVNGSRGGSSRGAVNAIWRRSGSTGRSTPAIPPTARDQAPAAQTTVGVTTSPPVVRTRARPSPVASIPVTAVPVRTSTPARTAAAR